MVVTKHVFSERFFEEEDRLGFHIDHKQKELWAVELDMLYELDRVCRKLKISPVGMIISILCSTPVGATIVAMNLAVFIVAWFVGKFIMKLS